MRNDEDVRKDLSQIKILFERLRGMREKEVVMARMGKMINHSEIREMNDLTNSIDSMLKRNSTIINFATRKLFEAEKNKFDMSMRSWENRKKFALQSFEKDLKRKDERLYETKNK